jgi:glucose-6-phosphate isomerase
MVEMKPSADSVAGAFAALAARREAIRADTMQARFAADPTRFAKFSLTLGTLTLDYSKNLIDDGTLSLLWALARAADVEGRRDAMFTGEAINVSEGRPVLHVALRAAPGAVIKVAGHNVVPDVQAMLDRMAAFSEGVRDGSLAGTGGRFTDVINIGIGGSDLGPEMTVKALLPFHDGPRVHFVSNVDGAHLRDTIASLDPGRTLVLVASKTFTTVETLTNARSARAWIAAAVGEQRVGTHFAALSTATAKVAAFGIAAERTFGFADWVGGRYSVWSAIGLPLMIAIGDRGFRAFLAGGRAVDEHFRSAPLAVNMPAILGLIAVLNRNVLGLPALAVIPYDQRLARFPAYLQQLAMESNGKRGDLAGGPVEQATAPVVFGEPGTNAQHAFFQMLHQGTDTVPVDFLIGAHSDANDTDAMRHQALLLASCFAQSEALMRGRTLGEVREEMGIAGIAAAEIERLAPHRVTPGNRPSNTLLYRQLDPETLGMLIALYEHKTFVEGAIWGVDSFDQWGVELGKTLASSLLPMIDGTVPPVGRDSSTIGLMAAARRLAPQASAETKTAAR